MYTYLGIVGRGYAEVNSSEQPKSPHRKVILYTILHMRSRTSRTLHFPTHVLSTELCRLRELTLVHEPGDRPYLCSTRDFATAVGTKIPQGHSATVPAHTPHK